MSTIKDNISSIPGRSDKAKSAKEKLKEYLEYKSNELLENHTHNHPFDEYDWWVSELINAAQEKGLNDGAKTFINHYYIDTTIFESVNGIGSISGEGTYVEGAVAELTATPGDDYVFDKWVSLVDGTEYVENPIRIEVSKSDILEAHFSCIHDGVVVTLNANQGTFSDNSFTRTVPVPWGQKLSDIEIPTRQGYTFKKFSNIDGSVSITINNNSVVYSPSGYGHKNSETFYAIWEATTCTVTFETDGGAFSDGGTSKNISDLYNKTKCAPDANDITFSGHVLSRWVDEDNPNNTLQPGATFSFSNVDGKTYKAEWVNQYIVSTQHNGGGSTTPPTRECRRGESITIEATPNAGYIFLRWVDINSDIISPDSKYTLTVTDNATYTAIFKSAQDTTGPKGADQQWINVSTDPPGAGSIDITADGGSIVTDTYWKQYYGYTGDTVSISTSGINENYTFSYWTINGEIIGDVDNIIEDYPIKGADQGTSFIAHYIDGTPPPQPIPATVTVEFIGDHPTISYVSFDEVQYTSSYVHNMNKYGTVDVVGINYTSSPDFTYDHVDFVGCTNQNVVSTDGNITISDLFVKDVDARVKVYFHSNVIYHNISIHSTPDDGGTVVFYDNTTTTTLRDGNNISGRIDVDGNHELYSCGVKYDNVGDSLVVDNTEMTFGYTAGDADQILNFVFSNSVEPDVSIEAIDVTTNSAVIHYTINPNMNDIRDITIYCYASDGDNMYDWSPEVNILEDNINVNGLTPDTSYTVNIDVNYFNGAEIGTVSDSDDFVTGMTTTYKVKLISDDPSLYPENVFLHISGEPTPVAESHGNIIESEHKKFNILDTSQEFSSWIIDTGSGGIDEPYEHSTTVIVSSEYTEIKSFHHESGHRPIKLTLKSWNGTKGKEIEHGAYFTINANNESRANEYYSSTVTLDMNNIILRVKDMVGFEFYQFEVRSPNSGVSITQHGTYPNQYRVSFDPIYLPSNTQEVVIYAYYIEEGVLPEGMGKTTLILDGGQPIEVLNNFGNDYIYNVAVNRENEDTDETVPFD